jgi:hypothetical protein
MFCKSVRKIIFEEGKPVSDCADNACDPSTPKSAPATNKPDPIAYRKCIVVLRLSAILNS